MDLAYIISAYKYPQQLIRLLRRLDSPQTSFLIHIDKKTDDEVVEQVVAATKDWTNVYLLERYTCHWGGFGHVQATLAGIREIFRRSIPFDYVVLLTGQDYPIKANQQIREFLEDKGGVSFIDYFALPTDQWEYNGLDRISRWHIRFKNRRLVFPPGRNFPLRRKFLHGFQPYGGSSYWCLSRECIEFIHHFVQREREFVDFFRFVDVPDELFFQTILLNSHLKDTLVNDDLRYIDWKDPDAGSPAVLGRDDFERIVFSPKLFARKFDMSVDAEILDLLDGVLES